MCKNIQAQKSRKPPSPVNHKISLQGALGDPIYTAVSNGIEVSDYSILLTPPVLSIYFATYSICQ